MARRISLSKIIDKSKVIHDKNNGIKYYKSINPNELVALLSTTGMIDIIPTISDTKKPNGRTIKRAFNKVKENSDLEYLYKKDEKFKKSIYHSAVLNLNSKDDKVYNKYMSDLLLKEEDALVDFAIQSRKNFIVLDIDNYDLGSSFFKAMIKEFGVNGLLIQRTHNTHKGTHILLITSQNKLKQLIDNKFGTYTKYIANNNDDFEMSEKSYYYSKINTGMRNRSYFDLFFNGKLNKINCDIHDSTMFSEDSNGKVTGANLTVIRKRFNQFDKHGYSQDQSQYFDLVKGYGFFEYVALEDNNRLTLDEVNDDFYELNNMIEFDDENKQFKTLSQKYSKKYANAKIKVTKGDFKDNNKEVAAKEVAKELGISKEQVIKFNFGKEDKPKDSNTKKRFKQIKHNKEQNKLMLDANKIIIKKSNRLAEKCLKALNNKQKYVNQKCFTAHNAYKACASYTHQQASKAIIQTIFLIGKFTNKDQQGWLVNKFSEYIHNQLILIAQMYPDSEINSWIDEFTLAHIRQIAKDILYTLNGELANLVIKKNKNGLSQENYFTTIFGLCPVCSLKDAHALTLSSYHGGYEDDSFEGLPTIGEILDEYNKKNGNLTNTKFAKYDKLCKLLINDKYDKFRTKITDNTQVKVVERTQTKINSSLIKQLTFNNEEGVKKIQTALMRAAWNLAFPKKKIKTNETAKIKNELTKLTQKLSAEDFNLVNSIYKKLVTIKNNIIKNSYEMISVRDFTQYTDDAKTNFVLRFVPDTYTNRIVDLYKLNKDNDNLGSIAPQYKLSGRRVSYQSENILALGNKLNDDSIDDITIRLNSDNFVKPFVRETDPEIEDKKELEAILDENNFKSVLAKVQLTSNVKYSFVKNNVLKSLICKHTKLQRLSNSMRSNIYIAFAHMYKLFNLNINDIINTNKLYEENNNIEKILNSDPRSLQKQVILLISMIENINFDKEHRLNKKEIMRIANIIRNTVFERSLANAALLKPSAYRVLSDTLFEGQFTKHAFSEYKAKYMKDHGISEEKANLANECLLSDSYLLEDRVATNILYADASDTNTQEDKEEIAHELLKSFDLSKEIVNNARDIDKELLGSNKEEVRYIPSELFDIKKFEKISKKVVNFINDKNNSAESDEENKIIAAYQFQNYLMNILLLSSSNNLNDNFSIQQAIALNKIQLQHQIEYIEALLNSKQIKTISLDEMKKLKNNKPKKEVHYKSDITIEELAEDLLKNKIVNKVNKGSRHNYFYSFITIINSLTNYEANNNDIDKLSNIINKYINNFVTNTKQFGLKDIKSLCRYIIRNNSNKGDSAVHFKNIDLNNLNYLLNTDYTNKTVFSLVRAKVAKKKTQKVKAFADEKLHQIYRVLNNKALVNGNKLEYNFNITNEWNEFNTNKLLDAVNTRLHKIYNENHTMSSRNMNDFISDIAELQNNMNLYDLYVLVKDASVKIELADNNLLNDSDNELGFNNQEELLSAKETFDDIINTYKKLKNSINDNNQLANELGLYGHSDKFIYFSKKSGDRKHLLRKYNGSSFSYMSAADIYYLITIQFGLINATKAININRDEIKENITGNAYKVFIKKVSLLKVLINICQKLINKISDDKYNFDIQKFMGVNKNATLITIIFIITNYLISSNINKDDIKDTFLAALNKIQNE